MKRLLTPLSLILLLAGCAGGGAAPRPLSLEPLLRAAPLPVLVAGNSFLDRPITREEDQEIRSLARRALSQSTTGGSRWFETPFTDHESRSLLHVELPPDYSNDQNYPLIVFMHGSWTNYDRVLDKLGLRKIAREGVILAVVDSRRSKIDGSGWNFFPERASVMMALRHVLTRYAVDEDRIHLWGHSNGAGGNMSVVSLYPGCWASLASFATVTKPQQVDRFATFKGLPLVIWQGRQDKNATSLFKNGQKVAKKFESQGHDIQFVVAPDHGHLPNAEEFSRVWKIHHNARRPAIPKDITLLDPRSFGADSLLSRDLTPSLEGIAVSRHHWLRVDQRIPGAGPWSCQGRITGQVVTLTGKHLARVSVLLNDSLVDLDKPVTILYNGQTVHEGVLPRHQGTLVNEILARGFVGGAASAVYELDLVTPLLETSLKSLGVKLPDRPLIEPDLRVINRVKLKGQMLEAQQFKHLNLCPSLATLSIQGCEIDDLKALLNHLGGSKSLAWLTVSEGGDLSGTQWAFLKKLPKLKSLSLVALGLTDDDLDRFPALESLTQLNLATRSGFSEPAVKRLRDRLPQCKIQIKDLPE